MKSIMLSLAATVACLTNGNAAPESDLANTAPEPAVREVEEQVHQAEDQVKQVQTQIKEAGKVWKQATKAMRVAQAAINIDPLDQDDDSDDHDRVITRGPNSTVRLWNLAGHEDDPESAFGGALSNLKDQIFTLAAPARAMAKPLVIGSGTLESKVQADIEEDLTVMSRILNKAVGERGNREDHEWAMGIALSSLGGGRRPQSIYLEGYGALFLVNVKFPLVAPPKKEVEDKKQDEASDSEWEQTKDELFGDHKTRRRGPMVQPFLGGEGNKVEYDSDRVADLKKSILEALKNASNIRNMKPDESITIAVTGPATAIGTKVRRVTRNEDAGPTVKKSGRVQRDVFAVVKTDKPLAVEETHLIVRAKKADADAFEKGKLTFEDFEKKASVVAY